MAVSPDARVDRLARGRATVERTGDGTRIVIPAKRNWFLVAFIVFWLAVWLDGTVSTATSRRATTGSVLTSVVFAAFGAVLGGGLLLWMLAGREEIVLGGERLLTRRKLGPLKRERDFAREGVGDLRFAPQSLNMFDWNAAGQFWGFAGGPVALDYGARTYRFGNGLDEAEAKQIAALLQAELNGTRT